MDLARLAEDFIKHGLYLRNWSKKTVRTYRQGLNAFQNALRQRTEGSSAGTQQFSADRLTKSDLDTFVIWMVRVPGRGGNSMRPAR
jgi:site-specific recombinase XerD